MQSRFNDSPPGECKYSYSRAAAPCQYPWYGYALITNPSLNLLGNRCGLNFEVIDHITIKQFSKVLVNYEPRSVGILKLNRWMVVDFLNPTCKTPFTYTSISLCNKLLLLHFTCLSPTLWASKMRNATQTAAAHKRLFKWKITGTWLMTLSQPHKHLCSPWVLPFL